MLDVERNKERSGLNMEEWKVLKDLEQNVEVSIRVLVWLKDVFDGDCLRSLELEGFIVEIWDYCVLFI